MINKSLLFVRTEYDLLNNRLLTFIHSSNLIRNDIVDNSGVYSYQTSGNISNVNRWMDF